MSKKPIIFFDIDYTLFDVAAFKKSNLKDFRLYEETKDILKKLHKWAVLGIFSEGEDNFQKAKLERTGIKKYFLKDNVYVFMGKHNYIENILNQYRGNKIFFVEDKLPILYEVKKKMSEVFGIWVKRGWYAENQKPIPGFKPDAEILSLKEVIEIVERNEMLK